MLLCDGAACTLYPVHNADRIRLYYYFSFAVAQDSGEFQTPLGKAQLGVGVVCAPDLGMGFISLCTLLSAEAQGLRASLVLTRQCVVHPIALGSAERLSKPLRTAPSKPCLAGVGSS